MTRHDWTVLLLGAAAGWAAGHYVGKLRQRITHSWADANRYRQGIAGLWRKAMRDTVALGRFYALLAAAAGLAGLFIWRTI